MKKIVLFFAIIFNNIILAQDDFQTIFSDGNRPLKKNIYLQLSDDQDNTVSIPVSIIKGKRPGAVFTIVAGVHGYEYPPIIAAQELIQELNPSKLVGTIVIIPIANPSAFFSRTPFLNPIDKLNLNRTFPGSKTGSITERTAHMLTTDIISVSDVFLDIHGGDANEDLNPFVCYYNNEEYIEKTKMAKMLAEASGFKHIVSYPYTLKKDQPAKYAFKQAVQDGKTALSIECGKLGNLQEEAVVSIKKAVYNMLGVMKMYDNASKSKIDFVNITGQVYIKSEYKGVFVSDYKAGDSVNEEDVVGHIKDVFGKTITELRAPKSGIILYKIGTPPVNTSETVMCIGY